MHVSYWFGSKIENFLFHGYNVISTWGIISTCIGLSALAILYESMKLLQIRLHELAKEHKQQQQQGDFIPNTDSSSLLSRASERSAEVNNSFHCYKWTKYFIEVFHWSIHVTLGYFLMLAVMTFNGYISIALIIGSGIGYYIFGPILLEFKMSKLQKRRRLIQCNPECTDAVTYSERTNSTISEHLNTEVNVDVNVDVHVKEEA